MQPKQIRQAPARELDVVRALDSKSKVCLVAGIWGQVLVQWPSERWGARLLSSSVEGDFQMSDEVGPFTPRSS